MFVGRTERLMSRELALRIVVDAKIRFGKPVIQGTRVPLDLLVGKVGGGITPEEVAEEYAVTVEDGRAAIQYKGSA